MNNIACLVLSVLPRVQAFSRLLMIDGKVKHSPFFSSLSVAAGSPVFLFPALLDHVMSFFVVVRSYSIYQLERFTRSNDVFTVKPGQPYPPKFH